MRFAVLVLLAVALVAQPAFGQEMATEQVAFGPFGTIVSPHGAGVC